MIGVGFRGEDFQVVSEFAAELVGGSRAVERKSTPQRMSSTRSPGTLSRRGSPPLSP
jgi:hypothetical protein